MQVKRITITIISEKMTTSTSFITAILYVFLVHFFVKIKKERQNNCNTGSLQDLLMDLRYI